MSGGSFDNLYSKWIDDLMNSEETLKRMRDDLRERGAIDAADQTDDVLRTIADAKNCVSQHQEALEKVWHAVEWHRSGDWGREDVEAALAEYRRRKSA